MYDAFVNCMNEEENQTIPQIVITACETYKLYLKTHELMTFLEGDNQ